jgi:hypothetical protein
MAEVPLGNELSDWCENYTTPELVAQLKELFGDSTYTHWTRFSSVNHQGIMAAALAAKMWLWRYEGLVEEAANG